MELFLNFAWAVVSIAVVCLWLRFEWRVQRDRREALIALIVLIAVLFPLISISDDLWQINNPAEIDTSLRRDHSGSCPHSFFPTIAAPPEPAIFELGGGLQRFNPQFHIPVLAFDNPAIDPLQNRPPPTA